MIEKLSISSQIFKFIPVIAWLGRIFGYGLVTGCEINSNEPPVMRDQQ